MSTRISDSRKRAFLKALGETGNVTVSAGRAKVSRNWAMGERKRDAGFDAAWRLALKASLDRLSTNGSTAPPRGWGHLDGFELVVRGSGGAPLRDAGGTAPQDERRPGRRVQIARARLHQWDGPTETRFLTTLSVTCNVKAALASVGMSKGSAYTHRKRSPDFARRWAEAVRAGYATLEGALLQSGLSLFTTPEEADFDAPLPEMSVAQVIHYLGMHRHEVTHLGRPPGRRRREG